MIDWLTILVALIIISGVVGFFAYLAWKINVADTLTLERTGERSGSNDFNVEKRKSQDQTKKKRKEQKKGKTNQKDDEAKEKTKSNEPLQQTSEETDDEHEESEQESNIVQQVNHETSSKARKRNKNKTTVENSAAVVREPPVTHPKSTNKVQVKQTQPTKKPTSQEIIEDDQPFTVVGGNKNKNNSSTSTTQVQQAKPTVVQTPTPTPTPAVQTNTETPKQVNGVVSQPAKVQSPVKLAEIVKSLPSSQVAMTELMLALDAYSLSADELDVIMHKIANKQAIIKQDWSKLQQVVKVDSKAQIAHATDDSSKAYQEGLKKVSEELNNEKRRSNELLKEKIDKERQIENLLSQVQSLSSKQNNESTQIRSNQENDYGTIQFQVLNEQMKKLSVENAVLEKKATRFEVLAEEAKKEKDEIRRSNENLTQNLDKVQKQFEENEEKSKFNEKQHRIEISELLVRLEQLEKDNEQLKKEEIVHVEPTVLVNTEEIEKLEHQIKELNEIQHSNHSQWTEKENQYQQKISELEQSKNHYELTQNQLNEYRRTLTELLPEHHRSELNQDLDHWLSSYRTSFERYVESLQKNWEEQCSNMKCENDRLRQDMTDIENQLKDIEQTVQNKEELLMTELKSKATLLDGVRHENEQLNEELKRVRSEMERLQTAHDTLSNEARALKIQLDERFLVATNTPPVVADESFELIKQPSPSLSPIVVDARAEHFTEFVRPDNESNEHADLHSQQNSTSDQHHHPSN